MDYRDYISPKVFDKQYLLSKKDQYQQYRCVVFESFFQEVFFDKVYKEILSPKTSFLSNVSQESSYNINLFQATGDNIKIFKDIFISNFLESIFSFFIGKKVRSVKKSEDYKNIHYRSCKDSLIIQRNNSGNFLDWHQDLDSVIVGNGLIYFNRDWNSAKGGALEIGIKSKNGEIEKVLTVPPKYNTFVILNGDVFHKISPISAGFERNVMTIPLIYS